MKGYKIGRSMKTLLCFLILAFAQSLFSSDPKGCDELLKFNFDDREWVEGFNETNSDGSIIEFTLKGETVDNWSELISVQRFLNVQASVDEYYKLFIAELEKAVKPDEVHTHIISKDKNSMFFEWWVDKESDSAQHEWFRLFKTPDSILVLRYTTKQLGEVDTVRPIWEKILKNAKVIQDCP